jgi:mannose-6-phosphate isomerase
MINDPIFLYNMRVERTYTGGKLLDQWQGIDPAKDGWMPEEWVASTIRSRFAENPDTGLSIIRNPELDGVFLKDYISRNPEAILGEHHYRKFGENLGFLTKLIDSDKRLNIQTHPDRKHAKLYFDSDYGKTEAWYVMDTRSINGEEPYILMGFKPGITKEKWIELIETQDREAMVEFMHKIPVAEGDVFIIESGVPHAIGSGCMIAEIQEPTDFTFRVEKIVSPDKVFPEETYHQGIGYEKMYNCFDYTSYTLEEIKSKMKLPVTLRENTDDYSIQPIVRTENTPFFSMEKVKVANKWMKLNDSNFAVAFVLNGNGTIHSGENSYKVVKGDEMFFPCSSGELVFSNKDSKTPLEILMCYPPDVVTL